MRWRTLGTTLAAFALLSGCGGADAEPDSKSGTKSSTAAKPLAGLSAKQILDKSLAAGRTAGSVHYVGDVVSENLSLDIRTSIDGDAEGTVSGDGAGTVELRRVGSRIYLKGDREFWTVSAGKNVAPLLVGKWFRDDVTDAQFGELGDLLSMDDFIDQLDEAGGTLTIVEGKDVDGQETVGIHDDGGAKGEEGTAYIANAAEPLMLLLTTREGNRLTLMEWGEPVTVELPPKDLVVDIDDLQGAKKVLTATTWPLSEGGAGLAGRP